MSRNYGMPYQGSKNFIAEDIIRKLPSSNRFVDLFGGGFAITHCAMLSGKWNTFLYNELNPLLPKLITEAIHGKYNYKVFKPQFISKEYFNENKEKDGYIKYIWSFSNSGKNYLFSDEIAPLKKSVHNWIVFNKKDKWFAYNFGDIDSYIQSEDIKARRMLWKRYLTIKLKKKRVLIDLQQLQQLERLQRLQQLERLERLQQLERLQLKCGSYLEYEYKDGDTVYCDPPYELTAGYSDDAFNHKEFYDWVASRDYKVYFSSYNNIADKRFKMIWARNKRSLMAGGVSTVKNYECLYINHD